MNNASGNEGDWLGLFPIDEIPLIFDVIGKAAKGVSKCSEHELEDRITERLFRKIRSLGEYRSAPFKVHPQFYVIAGSENELNGQIDIAFVIQDMDTYFAVEAKRLHVKFPSGKWKSLVSEYVSGNQGMMCFISQKYSKGLGAGAMLGYVYDRKVAKAKGAIAKSIKSNKAKLQLIGSEMLKGSKRIDPSLGVCETVHKIGSDSFVIYHMFIAV